MMTGSYPSPRDDRGFSAVFGAMILLGVVLVGYATYQTSLAPAMAAHSEAEQMDTVADKLTTWAATAGLADPATSSAPTTTSLPMGESQPPMARSAATSTVTFEPAAGSVDVGARNLSVTHLNGSSLGGTEEAWHPVDGGTVGEIARVEAFRLRVDTIDNDRAGESVQVNVTDATGAHVGDLQLAVEPLGREGGQGYELVVTTRDGDGTELYDQPILISSTTHDSHSDPISPYWVNLLNDDYRFASVLAAAEAPYEVELSRDGLDADYTLTYARTHDRGTTSGTGTLVESYRQSRPGGRLAFQAHADHADDQTIAVEHGAVVRSQTDGAVFARSPGFDLTTVGHQAHVSFTWPTLTGSPDARSSQAPLGLHGTPEETYAVRGQATNVTINVTTSEPRLWEGFFVERGLEAGLSPGQGFTTATGSDWARVDVWGLLAPDPSSDRSDVSLDLRSVTTATRLG